MDTLLIIENTPQNYYPVTLNRPIMDLFCGTMSFRERIEKIYSNFKVEYCFRERVDFSKRNSSLDIDQTYFIDPTIKDLKKIKQYLSEIDKSEGSIIFSNGEKPLFGYLTGDDIKKFINNDISDIDQKMIEVENYNYLWDIVNDNHNIITKDLPLISEQYKKICDIENVTLVKRENIFVKDGVKIKAGTIVDASEGVVIIDEDVEIMHNSVIIGPTYIGKKSRVKIGAKIYENCSFGPVSKVGGECEAVIFQGYSNKQHDGFLGHAFIGSWCNFGADTNNSDLKNNYREVKVELSGELVDTGSQFAGLFMGDHTKTGINTMFDTGTAIGVGCNVYGEGFPKRSIPSFNWGGKSKLIKYPISRILDTSKVVMDRRGCSMSEKEEQFYRDLFKEGEQYAW